jgi:rare lipoprotein A
MLGLKFHKEERMMKLPGLIALVLALILPVAANAANVQEGEASYYSDKLDGNKTASGETYDKNALTAAHRSLPFGTRVKVTYLKTGKSVEVVINDRGPHAKNRIIDLSGAAAREIGLIKAGHGKIKLEIQ